MPRIPHKTLLNAYRLSPLLPLVLRGCRDLPSAKSEFRWLIEHVLETHPTSTTPKGTQYRELFKLCKRRERSEPLQYILGSQPFGELDLKCRRGVLIPRYVVLLSAKDDWIDPGLRGENINVGEVWFGRHCWQNMLVEDI